MKQKIFTVLISIILLAASGLYANSNDNQRKHHIGISSGINQYGYFTGDLFFGTNPFRSSKNIEINAGYSYFCNHTDFDNFKGIIYSSHGLFCDANYFLLSNVFIGVRLAIDGNFVDEKSQNEYTSLIGKEPPLFFLGKTLLFNLGLNIPFEKNLNFRIIGQAGVHNYEIQTGWQIGNSSSPIAEQIQDTHAKELQLKLMANIKGVFLIRF
jgi:hypothetical protein